MFDDTRRWGEVAGALSGPRRSLLRLEVMEGTHPLLIRAKGVLDAPNVGHLLIQVRCRLSEGDVVLDVDEISLCDSAGLQALVDLERHARQVSTTFQLTGLRDHMARMFSLTGIDRVVPVVQPDDRV